MGSNPIFGTTPETWSDADGPSSRAERGHRPRHGRFCARARLGRTGDQRRVVDLIGDNVLTAVNLAIATFVLENAVLAFVVVAGVVFALGVIENRRDRDRP